MGGRTKQRAEAILRNWLRDVRKSPCSYYQAAPIDENLFAWRVTVLGQPGTHYEGGVFPARIDFPEAFPDLPPTMRFLCPMFHPNIAGPTHPTPGLVCISILHPPGRDPMNPQEAEQERWLPIHNLESIVVSVVSMLECPNPESPLNVEANRIFIQDQKQFWRRVRRCSEEAINYTRA